MEKYINTARGGVNPIKINGLVAEQISKDLATRLLNKTYLRQERDLVLYVSNQGDNSTADGSQDKPFKTLSKCLRYILNYVCTNYFIKINFLTDYIETEDVIKIRAINMGGFLEIISNGHNVVLNHIKIYQGFVTFKGINFKQTYDDNLLYCADSSVVYFTDTFTVTLKDNCVHRVFYPNRNSHMQITETANITINGTTTGKGAELFRAQLNCSILMKANSFTIGNSLTNIVGINCYYGSIVLFIPQSFIAPPRPDAQAYYASYNSHISFNGKGKPQNLGGLTTVDQTSSIS